MHWAYKMQFKVALSTTEAENISLSQGARDLLPIKQMIDFLNKVMNIDSENMNAFSTAFESNSSALQLALESKHRLRVKHIYLKCYYFRQCVKNKKN